MDDPSLLFDLLRAVALIIISISLLLVAYALYPGRQR